MADKHPMLFAAVDAVVERFDTGGRLRVEHDENGPVRIVGPFDVVWERCEEPWP